MGLVFKPSHYGTFRLFFYFTEFMVLVTILRHRNLQNFAPRFLEGCLAFCDFIDFVGLVLALILLFAWRLDDLNRPPLITAASVSFVRFLADIFMLFFHPWKQRAGERARNAAINSQTNERAYRVGAGARESSETCAICLERFQEGESITAISCEHEFHTSCIREWLHISDRCPMCRANAIEGPTEPLESAEDNVV